MRGEHYLSAFSDEFLAMRGASKLREKFTNRSRKALKLQHFVRAVQRAERIKRTNLAAGKIAGIWKGSAAAFLQCLIMSGIHEASEKCEMPLVMTIEVACIYPGMDPSLSPFTLSLQFWNCREGYFIRHRHV